MSLFKRLWENFLSEGKVDNIGYEFGNNVNTSLTKVVGHGSRLQVFAGKHMFACLYLRYWVNGLEFGWGMWRENLHTGTTYSLIDCSDLLFVFIKVGSESLC